MALTVNYENEKQRELDEIEINKNNKINKLNELYALQRKMIPYCTWVAVATLAICITVAIVNDLVTLFSFICKKNQPSSNNSYRKKNTPTVRFSSKKLSNQFENENNDDLENVQFNFEQLSNLNKAVDEKLRICYLKAAENYE